MSCYSQIADMYSSSILVIFPFKKAVVPVHNPSWCLGHLTPLTPSTNRRASVPGAFQCPQTSEEDFETGKSLQSTPFRIAKK
ncbi:hypothetical protein CEXT_645731 [Caerostris extrusa]|uniref:Uncharacterized protein n=1 Tax=Caerostris extrusa TaxID=172846 RepID=A0AAV4YA42_CAEEX|nr:hypothetical protein CEXT_645731 [Caerostris extrusa]